MDELLSLSFVGLAILFGVWNALILTRWVRYLKVAPTVRLSWLPERPWYFGLCLGIGLFMLVLTAISLFVLERPPLVVIAQALMAVFYTAVFPLSFRIRRGFFAEGLWTERGFVPYRNIRWLGWKETPAVVLAVRANSRFTGQRYAFLRVPGSRYGEARRILADTIEHDALQLETSVLGLNEDSSTQERV